jgi:lipoprotein-releasing system ATP-binding protein
MKSTLQLVTVSKQFISAQTIVTVIRDLSITFRQGATYAIMGISGSGKSTLMHLLAGIEKPNEGYIMFDDKRLDTLTASEQAYFLNQSIGLLFQKPYVIRELSVIENVMLPAQIAGVSAEAARKQALILLDSVGLADKQNMPPAALSGGQQQRIALARALCNKPAFLLADEPTGSLDEHTALAITELLSACQREWGMGLIVSTHDKRVASAMQTVLQLHEGTLQLQR